MDSISKLFTENTSNPIFICLILKKNIFLLYQIQKIGPVCYQKSKYGILYKVYS